MTGYGSLFERLNGDADKRVGWSREVSAMASVAAHLGKMLSTRAGSVQTLSDYGLPDLNDMRLSLHDSLSQARSAIEGFIEAYEPRLSDVRVVSLPRDNDQLRLAFSIEGLLEVGRFQAPGEFFRMPGWQRPGEGQLRRFRCPANPQPAFPIPPLVRSPGTAAIPSASVPPTCSSTASRRPARVTPRPGAVPLRCLVRP